MRIDDSHNQRWQKIVDLMAEMIDVPAGLIMRLHNGELEVLVKSNSDNNPYKVGEHETMDGSGLYCETVIKNNSMLKVPDSLSDEKWKNNPDVKLNMVSYLGFPIRYPDKTSFGTICVLDNKENHYSETYERLVESFRDFIEMELELILRNYELTEISEKDQLTNILNRQSFYVRVEAELDRVKRYKNPFTLLMLDLDKFKNINDEYGHQAGDAVLIAFVNHIKTQIRPSDFLGRFGGEEFLLALPNTDKIAARNLATRILKSTESLDIPYKDFLIPLTVSIGLVEYSDGFNLENLIEEADATMYMAKKAGRNTVKG